MNVQLFDLAMGIATICIFVWMLWEVFRWAVRFRFRERRQRWLGYRQELREAIKPTNVWGEGLAAVTAWQFDTMYEIVRDLDLEPGQLYLLLDAVNQHIDEQRKAEGGVA